MRLERLKLLDFRSFGEVDLAFPHRANLFVGPNGAGKTNLLESMVYLSLAKSHRGAKDRDLVKFGREGFRIEGDARKREGELKIEVAFTPLEKKIAVNSSRLTVTELVGNLPVVWLSSDDIETTRGMPLQRRRFIDMIISFLRPSYFAALMGYRRVLEQRNRALAVSRSDRGTYRTLEAWNVQLVELGSELIRSRTGFADELANLASRYYRDIAPGEEKYGLTYLPSIPLDGSSVENSFARKLAETEGAERERGMTLVGPHRDDYVQKLDGRDMRIFASEGQQRTASMSLKLAGAELVREETGEWPIVIFDEVFAELDRERCLGIAKIVENLDQVFVATATSESTPGLDCDEFLVQRGEVRSLS